jgi:hypothetical protein
MVTIGSIWSGTLRFMSGNIPAIAVWSGLMVLFSFLSMSAMAPFYVQMAAMQAGSQQVPDVSGFFLAMLVTMLGLIVLWAAAFRAVLFPQQRKAFYLRVGMDELRLLGVVLVVFIGGYIAALIAGVVLSVIFVLIGRIVGGVGGSAMGGLVSMLLIFCGMIWAAIRVSPCGPMTIYRRQVIIGPAWRLTKGVFWRLLGAYLLAAVVLIVAYSILFVAQLGMSGSGMGGGQQALQAVEAMQGSASFQTRAVIALLAGLIGGVGLAFHAGMTAVATRELLGLGDNRLEDVFE